MPPEVAEQNDATTNQSNVDQSFADLLEQVSRTLDQQGAVDMAEVAQAHPQHADRLRRLLPAMAAMASWARDSSAGASGEPRTPGTDQVSGVLGDFRIIRQIGRGGMGVVYEAEQISMRRHVALKVLSFAALVQEKALQRFRNEVRAAATLDHPHIVSIYLIGEERGVHYYAMRLIRGQTLADLIHELRKENSSHRPLILGDGSGRGVGSEDAPTIDSAVSPPPSTKRDEQARISTVGDLRRTAEHFRSAARLGIQAAEALQHAHDLGVLHRDIKPSNLMLDGEGQLFVTDFGLARIEADAGMTMTGDIVGTLRYMAPEQALAKRVVIDHRADIYSLGATLYELLTLQPAFFETDRSELLKQIAFEEPKPLRKLDRRIPGELETIVLKAISKNPDERYQTAQRLADDLRAFLEDRPIKAKPPTWRERTVKWARRHPAGVRATIFALLATVIAAAASVGWVSRDRAAREAFLVDQVTTALDEAKKWYEAGELTDAMSTIKRAESFLASGEGSDKSKESVAQSRANIETAQQLEQLRLDRGAKGGGQGDEPFDDAYQEVFRKYGIDLRTLDDERAAKQIRNSPIKDELVRALHDWFQLGASDAKGGRERKFTSPRPELLQIARLADPDPWRNRLRDAVERGDEPALLSLAQEKEALDQPPATITLLAQALVARRKQIPAAIELLEQAQWRHPNDFWINITLANCLRFIHPQRTDEAITFRRIAVALRPDSGRAYNHLGVALAGDGQLAAAAEAYRQAVRLNPADFVSRGNLCAVLIEQGKHADAEAVFREIERLKPSEIGAGLWLHFGKTAEAEAAIREQIRRTPNSFQAHDSLGAILATQGKHAEAELAYREAIRIRPDIVRLHCSLVEALDLQGKRDDAEAELRQALQLEPSDHRECYVLAAVLLRLGKTDDAEKAMRESVRRAPSFFLGQLGLSQILLNRKKYPEAAAALREVVRLAPEKAEALNTLAWLLATAPDDTVRDGKFAVELATRACEIAEYKQSNLIDTLAAAHAEAGDFDAAVDWQSKAVELADNDQLRKELKKHLEIFQAGKPWREEPPAKSD